MERWPLRLRILIAAAACLAAAACTKPARDASPARSEAAETVPAPVPEPKEGRLPELGEAIEVPALKLGDDQLLLAYRHTGFAYLDANGFDTEVYRFRKNPSGTLKSVSVAKVLMDGETLTDAVDFLHTDRAVTLRSSFQGRGVGDCVLEPEGTALVARGADFIFSYAAPEGGGLRIERRYGTRVYIEEWGRDGASTVSDTMEGGAKGHFEGGWPLPKLYLERPDKDPSGATDVRFDFFDTEKGIKFRADSVVPLGEGFLMGFESAFPQGLPLEALALLDISLGAERRITPLLVRLYFGRK